ncbi:hypothetical protein CEXT_52421 [Caerostris extrusa]|uniref:Secreted protein n=1 Tax=Caerostris extrusa TaxID=172846 RepID=A0AAV4RQW7_CAEEX|nr:hypothetical protein CEXT_52421 [Caerostris extrusa]
MVCLSCGERAYTYVKMHLLSMLVIQCCRTHVADVWRKAICIIKPSSTLHAFMRENCIFLFSVGKPAVNCCNLLNNFVPVHPSQLDRHLQFRSVTSGVTIHHVTDHVRCRPSRQSLFTPRTSFIFPAPDGAL